jgi:hypothetical protein
LRNADGVPSRSLPRRSSVIALVNDPSGPRNRIPILDHMTAMERDKSQRPAVFAGEECRVRPGFVQLPQALGGNLGRYFIPELA